MELTKSDIEAIARRRFNKALNKIPYLIIPIILLILIIPTKLLPSPWDIISIIFDAAIIIYLLMRMLYKEDRFTKDFIRRWESGEITFNKEVR